MSCGAKLLKSSLLASALYLTSFSFSSALAFDPLFDGPTGAPGPIPFHTPHGAPFPLPPSGLPPVFLPGSGSQYGGMLPVVSTSSVDFDIAEVDAPQGGSNGAGITFNASATAQFNGQEASTSASASIDFDNGDNMGY